MDQTPTDQQFQVSLNPKEDYGKEDGEDQDQQNFLDEEE
jgi:hypothetical protein